MPITPFLAGQAFDPEVVRAMATAFQAGPRPCERHLEIDQCTLNVVRSKTVVAVPWLLGVARHKLADHYRRRHDRLTVPVGELPEPVLEAAGVADDWDAELDRLVAESVLARLTEPHRTVLILRYMDDCSVGEVRCSSIVVP